MLWQIKIVRIFFTRDNSSKQTFLIDKLFEKFGKVMRSKFIH